MATSFSTAAAARFAAPELLALGPPPDTASLPWETLRTAALDDLAARLAALNVPFNVQNLLSDPNVKVSEAAAYRDQLRRREIDNAVARTYLGSATGPYLDARAADYGVLRRSIPYAGTEDATRAEPTRPSDVPSAWTWDVTGLRWIEDDAALLLRARLAWEALSVAGPPGAYVFHALDAHPNVLAGVAYGPETGIVEPGNVLVVIQSNLGSGVPSFAVLEAVADRLDAYVIVDGTGAETTRVLREDQSVRPLGARVTIAACQPLALYVEAVLHVSPGPDAEALRLEAIRRMNAYLASRNRVGLTVTRSGLISALSLTDADGVAAIPDLDLTSPAADVTPDHKQLVVLGNALITTDVL